MNANVSPFGPTAAPDAQESSQSRTERIIAGAEALLATGGRSIAQSDLSLKQSRALATANTAADARGPLARLCIEVSNEVAAVNFEPTVEQVKMWREKLLEHALREGSSGG